MYTNNKSIHWGYPTPASHCSRLTAVAARIRCRASIALDTYSSIVSNIVLQMNRLPVTGTQSIWFSVPVDSPQNP